MYVLIRSHVPVFIRAYIQIRPTGWYNAVRILCIYRHVHASNTYSRITIYVHWMLKIPRRVTWLRSPAWCHPVFNDQVICRWNTRHCPDANRHLEADELPSNWRKEGAVKTNWNNHQNITLCKHTALGKEGNKIKKKIRRKERKKKKIPYR